VADARHGELLCRRRAEQGIAIETVLRAYHTGYDIMWNELHARVVARDPAREVDLLPVVSTMMTWLRSITGRVAEGYEAVTAAREESRLALAQVFVTGLAQGNAGSEAVEAAARGLGFDPTGPFQVLCAPARVWEPEGLHRLRRAMRPPSAVTVAGHTLTVILQNASMQSVLPRLGERPVAGVGLSRPGLAGAAESLTDAERALALAEQRGAVVHFEQDWLLATLLPEAARLAPLTDARGADDHAHLAEAVRAYAGHQFSITASAAALHVHANTLKYRLTRWQQITGWDPRTLDGLMRSLISLAAQAR
jgi:sugar diacid utilization regulator